MIQVEIDKSDLDAVKAAMYGIKNGYRDVMRRATNKTLVSVQSGAVKGVAADLWLTQKRIKEDITLKKMTFTRRTASFKATGKPVPLGEFRGTEPREKGVTVKVKTKGKRSIIPQAFMVPGKGGKKLIVGRRRYKGPRTSASRYLPWAMFSPSKKSGFRYPVKWLTGPRIEDIMEKVIELNLDKTWMDIYLKNINSELNFELSKL